MPIHKNKRAHEHSTEPKKSQGVYVISNSINMKNNKYKIGVFSGSELSILLNRYRPALIDPELMFYMDIGDIVNARHIKKQILSKFGEERIINDNGNMSEWIQIDFHILRANIVSIINDHYTRDDNE